MKIRWPWILKAKHEKQIVDLCVEHARLLGIERSRFKDEKEKLLQPLVNKLMRVQVDFSGDRYNCYRLCVDLDTRFVERVLEHGNSHREIVFMCEEVAQEVRRELERIIKGRNFVRRNIDE